MLLALAYLTCKKYFVLVCYHMNLGLVDVVHLLLLEVILATLLEVQVENGMVIHGDGTTKTEAQNVIVIQVRVDIFIDCLNNFALLFLPRDVYFSNSVISVFYGSE